jgi:hypothetical protein
MPRSPARADDLAARQNEWMGVVARMRISKDTKLVLVMAAVHADWDGTSMFPGTWRLVVETGTSRMTVQRALRLARDLGLVELVRRGNRRRGQADEYRLIISPDTWERAIARGILILNPAEVRRLADEYAAAKAERDAKRRRDQAPPSGA